MITVSPHGCLRARMSRPRSSGTRDVLGLQVLSPPYLIEGDAICE